MVILFSAFYRIFENEICFGWCLSWQAILLVFNLRLLNIILYVTNPLSYFFSTGRDFNNTWCEVLLELQKILPGASEEHADRLIGRISWRIVNKNFHNLIFKKNFFFFFLGVHILYLSNFGTLNYLFLYSQRSSSVNMRSTRTCVSRNENSWALLNHWHFIYGFNCLLLLAFWFHVFEILKLQSRFILNS